MKKVEKLRRTRKKWKFMCKVFWRSNLKVFVEEAWLLHHSDLLFLFVFPNEGELFGEGRSQLIVGGLQLPDPHLGTSGRQMSELGFEERNNYLNNVALILEVGVHHLSLGKVH